MQKYTNPTGLNSQISSCMRRGQWVQSKCRNQGMSISTEWHSGMWKERYMKRMLTCLLTACSLDHISLMQNFLGQLVQPLLGFELATPREHRIPSRTALLDITGAAQHFLQYWHVAISLRAITYLTWLTTSRSDIVYEGSWCTRTLENLDWDLFDESNSSMPKMF
jgi:hypothetical protein